jgi:hypothetical protein
VHEPEKSVPSPVSNLVERIRFIGPLVGTPVG